MNYKKLIPLGALAIILASCGSPTSASVDSVSQTGSNPTSVSTSEPTSVSTSESTSVSINDSISTSTSDSTSNSTSDSITVTENNISAAALASVQTSFKLTGGYVITDEDSIEYEHQQMSVFDENEYYLYDIFEGKEVGKIHVRREGSKVFKLDVNAKNELIKTDITSNYPWALFENPFVGLATTDFVEDNTNKGVFSVSAQKMTALANGISGYNETVLGVDVTVANDVITAIRFLTYSVDGTISYDYAVSGHGTAKAPAIPYVSNDDLANSTLATALASIGNNYTIEHFDSSETFDDISYKFYITEDAVYKDVGSLEGEVSTGFLLHNSLIYGFEVAEETPILKGVSQYELIDIMPDFNFVAELFYYEGEGVYTTHDATIAGLIGSMVAEEYNLKGIAAFSHTLSIILNNDKIHQITYSFNCFGQLIGDITMTFTDIGTTDLPVDLSALIAEIDNEDEEIDFSFMYGTYTGKFYGSQDTHTFVLNEDGVTFDGAIATVEGFNEDNDLVVTVNGNTYALTYETGYEPVALSVADNVNYKYGLFSKVEVEEETDDYSFMYGTYSGKLSGSQDVHTFVISEDGVTFDGAIATVEGFNEDNDLVVIVNGVTYALTYETGYDPVAISVADMVNYKFGLFSKVADGGGEEEDPVDLALLEIMHGDWEFVIEGNKIAVLIDETGITFDGIKAVITDIYDYWGINVVLTVDGVTYYMAHCEENAYGDPEMIVLCDANEDEIAIGSRAGGEEEVDLTLLEIMHGEWEFVIEGNKIAVLIDETGITFDGIKAVITDIYDYWGINVILSVDGVTYYMAHCEEAYGDPEMIVLCDANEDEIAIGSRASGEEPTSFEFPNELVGTYTGKYDSGDKEAITFVIAKNSLTINGVEATDISFEGGYYYYSLEGVEFYFSDWDGSIYISSVDGSIFSNGLTK